MWDEWRSNHENSNLTIKILMRIQNNKTLGCDDATKNRALTWLNHEYCDRFFKGRYMILGFFVKRGRRKNKSGGLMSPEASEVK